MIAFLVMLIGPDRERRWIAIRNTKRRGTLTRGFTYVASVYDMDQARSVVAAQARARGTDRFVRAGWPDASVREPTIAASGTRAE